MEDEDLEGRKRRRLVSHMKYTNIEQRSPEYELKKRYSRKQVKRSFQDLDRATPVQLAKMLIKDGILVHLGGAPCVNTSCSETNNSGYLSKKTLGSLRATSIKQCSRMFSKNVCYRCVSCRNRVPVNRGSAIFPSIPGGYGVKERALSYWNLIHGASIPFTAAQLGLSNDSVAAFYADGRAICEHDALRMEKLIVFGTGSPLTADIECDEHCWCTWQIGDHHYFFAWVGIEQRGAPSKLFLRPNISSDNTMLPGVTYSVGEGRVPPLTSACLESVLKAAFTDETNAILMTDSARAYQALQLGRHGIWEKYLVNHSDDEYTRPEQAGTGSFKALKDQPLMPSYILIRQFCPTWKPRLHAAV